MIMYNKEEYFKEKENFFNMKKVLIYKWYYDRFGCDCWYILGEGVLLATTETAYKLQFEDNTFWVENYKYRVEEIYENNIERKNNDLSS